MQDDDNGEWPSKYLWIWHKNSLLAQKLYAVHIDLYDILTMFDGLRGEKSYEQEVRDFMQKQKLTSEPV